MPTIFLDDGGVLNDNSRRAPQWQRLVGEFLTPRLGGTRLDWANANAAVAGPVFNEHVLQAGQDPEHPGGARFSRMPGLSRYLHLRAFGFRFRSHFNSILGRFSNSGWMMSLS